MTVVTVRINGPTEESMGNPRSFGDQISHTREVVGGRTGAEVVKNRIFLYPFSRVGDTPSN